MPVILFKYGGFAELQGGDFGSSFLSGFTGSIAGSMITAKSGDESFFGAKNEGGKYLARRTVAAAVVGGTTSEIAGGKFANGAATAAMVHLLNHEGGGVEHSHDPRAPRVGETYEEYRARLVSMRSDTWEGELTYDFAVAGPVGGGYFEGSLTNTGSLETIAVAGKVGAMAFPLGTVSGKINITVTGYTNPVDLRGASLGLATFSQIGVAAGPLDLGSVVRARHINPGTGRMTITNFFSRGDWDLSNWKLKVGPSSGMVGFQNQYAPSATQTPYPYQ